MNISKLIHYSIRRIWLVLALYTAWPSVHAQVPLFENNHSDYVIVIPDKPAAAEKQAAELLADYFKQSTGYSLKIRSDRSEPSGREILLGSTNRLERFKIRTRAEKLDPDGFVILTDEERLIIQGGSPAGTRNGVYFFLEEYLGCRMYAPGATAVPRMERIALSVIKYRFNPVFDFREVYFPARQDKEFVQWHRLHSHHDGSWGMWVHTFDDLVSPKSYFKEHPEYFSEINGLRVPDGQLCLSNPGVFSLLTENLRIKMEGRPKAQYWSVSQNDNFLACQCPSCTAIAEDYGGQSGLMIWFVNRVAEQFPDKVISTLAYQYTRSAPAGIKPLPNVNIMLCSIECNRSKPLNEDPTSESFVRDVKEWSRLTDNILIWDYVVQFRNYISPFPNLRVLQPNLAFFADEDCRMVFQQGSMNSVSEFHELRTYLIAKLMWDPYQDARAVMEDFMAGYYRAAAPFLLDYIDMLHDELAIADDNLWIYGYPYSGIDSYLRPELIPEYERLFDRAEAAVAEEPEILKRVKTARLPLEFAILDIALHRKNDYPAWITIEGNQVDVSMDLMQRLGVFVSECAEAGISILNEQGLTPVEYREQINHYLIRSKEPNLGVNREVTLLTEYSPKYDVGGAAALTDGLRGTNNYYFNWLGFEGNDLEAVIDLGSEMTVREVSAGFLQDIRSWIFLPRSVEVQYSGDGFTYTSAGINDNITPDNKTGSFIQTFRVSFTPVQARYIRIKANALKTCPGWHLGKGKPSWIFTDEVIVK